MRHWLMSLRGAVTLSVIAMLSLVARITGLDAMFVMPGEMGVREDQVLIVGQIMVGVMAIYGAWLWALLAAVQGSRGGVIVALIFSLLTALFGGLFTLVVLCQPRCAAPPVGDVIVWAELISGLTASAALGLQLRPVRQQRKAHGLSGAIGGRRCHVWHLQAMRNSSYLGAPSLEGVVGRCVHADTRRDDASS